jgi:MYXO-CTERM domain-containing protein
MSLRNILDRSRKHFARCIASAALVAAAAPAHAAYVLNEITMAGASDIAAWDINNSGTIVGYSVASGSTFSRGYMLSGGTFTSIGPAGSVSSVATGISDSGLVVGSYASTTALDDLGNTIAGPQVGFIYNGTSYTSFIVAGATETLLRAISPDGRYLSGYYSTDTQAGVGFVYDTLAGSLGIVSVPGSLLTIAQGINSAGILVGSDILPGGVRPGFTYDIATGTRTDFMLPGSTRTSARSIDDAGVLAGWYTEGGVIRGFVGSASSFETIEFAGATGGTFVEGSNNAGTLVGTYTVDDVSHAFIAQRVSAPGSLALTLLALGALGVVRRRRP